MRAALWYKLHGLESAERALYELLIRSILEPIVNLVHKLLEKLVEVFLDAKVYLITLEVFERLAEGYGIVVLAI